MNHKTSNLSVVKNRLLSFFSFVLLVTVVSSQVLYSQSDLRKSERFFNSRKADYEKWLGVIGASEYFEVTDLRINQDTVTLHLGFTNIQNNDCVALGVLWSKYRNDFGEKSKQSLHKIMLQKLSFQMGELGLDSLEIKLFCQKKQEPLVHIYGEKSRSGTVKARMIENINKQMGDGTILVAFKELPRAYLNRKRPIPDSININIEKAKKAVGKFFYDEYISKGTEWVWNAKIDTSKTYRSHFVYKVSHISGEVLVGRNFFEMHRIQITIEEINNQLSVAWDFQAKYGGGLIYPPRESSSDYHDIEISPYKDLFEEYQKDLFLRLEEYILKS